MGWVIQKTGLKLLPTSGKIKLAKPPNDATDTNHRNEWGSDDIQWHTVNSYHTKHRNSSGKVQMVAAKGTEIKEAIAGGNHPIV